MGFPVFLLKNTTWTLNNWAIERGFDSRFCVDSRVRRNVSVRRSQIIALKYTHLYWSHKKGKYSLINSKVAKSVKMSSLYRFLVWAPSFKSRSLTMFVQVTKIWNGIRSSILHVTDNSFLQSFGYFIRKFWCSDPIYFRRVRYCKSSPQTYWSIRGQLRVWKKKQTYNSKGRRLQRCSRWADVDGLVQCTK